MLYSGLNFYTCVLFSCTCVLFSCLVCHVFLFGLSLLEYYCSTLCAYQYSSKMTVESEMLSICVDENMKKRLSLLLNISGHHPVVTQQLAVIDL